MVCEDNDTTGWRGVKAKAKASKKFRREDKLKVR